MCSKFITFEFLSEDDTDDLYSSGTSEELANLIFGDEKPNLNKKLPMSVSINSIDKYYPYPEDKTLTELCTIDGDVIVVNEAFKLFDRRIKEESGQEPQGTWSIHQSEDKLAKIRVYNN